MAPRAPRDEDAHKVAGPSGGDPSSTVDNLDAFRAAWLARRYALPVDAALLIAVLALGEVGA